jgi:ribosomal protein L7/L12
MNSISAIFIVIVAMAFILAMLRLVKIQSQATTLTRLEAKVDLLLKQAGIDYDPYKAAPQAVLDALRQGKGKLQAIKIYRDGTGVGLKVAKDFVEELMRRNGINS